MQVYNCNNLSFGKIVFADKTVEEKFLNTLFPKKMMTKKNICKKFNQIYFCRNFIENENKNPKRIFFINTKNVDSKELFTCSGNKFKDEVFGLNKHGKQSFWDFIMGIYSRSI